MCIPDALYLSDAVRTSEIGSVAVTVGVKCALFDQFHQRRHAPFGSGHCAAPIVALSSKLLGIKAHFSDGGFGAIDYDRSISLMKVVDTHKLFMGLKIVIDPPDANNKLFLV